MQKIDEEIAKLRKVAEKLYNLDHHDEADIVTSVLLALTEISQELKNNARQD